MLGLVLLSLLIKYENQEISGLNKLTDTKKDVTHNLCSGGATADELSRNEFLYPSEESNHSNQAVPATESGCSSLDHDYTPAIAEVSVAENEELEMIGKMLVGVCCDKECFRHLTANDIITARTDFVQLTKPEQKQYLFTKLRENSSESSGKIETKYFLAGKEICCISWTKIYSISVRTLTRMLKDISFGEKHVAHKNQGKKRVNTKKELLVAWMERYFNLIGDKMPDTKQIHLPSWETRKDIHTRYCQDMQLRGIEQEEISGSSTFYKVWTEQFTHVVIPEVCNFII